MKIHHAKKRLGQNFLIDENLIQKIIQLIQPKSLDQMIEIGPGKGALTFSLIPYLENLQVIELDRDLTSYLEQSFKAHNKLTIHHNNALHVNFEDLLINKEKKLRVVGNLPYNISTPLMFHLLKFANCIEDMHFMLQKEVVDRLAASVNTPSYGRLSIMIQYYCDVIPLLAVSPSAFLPQPQVDSVFVRLIPHPPIIQAANHTRFSHLVRDAFNQRRKTIRNSLSAFLQTADFEKLDIDPKSRAEQLTLKQFILIDHYLENLTS